MLGVTLDPGDEDNAFVVERFIPREVGIPFIEYGDIASIQRYGGRYFSLMDFAGGYNHEGRQVSRVIEFNMQLYRALLGAEPGPVI
jgi:hypothetical protein